MEQPIISDNIDDENLEEEIYIIPKKTKSVKKIKSKSSRNNVNQIETDASAVLTLCPLPESFNKDILEEDIKKYMKPREEYYKHKNIGLYSYCINVVTYKYVKEHSSISSYILIV